MLSFQERGPSSQPRRQQAEGRRVKMARLPIVHEIDLTEIDEDGASTSAQGLRHRRHQQPLPRGSSSLRSNASAGAAAAGSKRPVCEIDLAMASDDDNDDEGGEGGTRPWATTAAERGVSERGGGAAAAAAGRPNNKRRRPWAPPAAVRARNTASTVPSGADLAAPGNGGDGMALMASAEQHSHSHHQREEAAPPVAPDPKGVPSVPSLAAPGAAAGSLASTSQRPPRPLPLREDEDLHIIGSHQQAAARVSSTRLPPAGASIDPPQQLTP